MKVDFMVKQTNSFALVTKELSEDENYWFKSLRDDLEAGEEVQRFVKRYDDRKYEAYYLEVMNLIVRANLEKMKERKRCARR